MVDDVFAYQKTGGAADEDVGWKVLLAHDPGETDAGGHGGALEREPLRVPAAPCPA